MQFLNTIFYFKIYSASFIFESFIFILEITITKKSKRLFNYTIVKALTHHCNRRWLGVHQTSFQPCAIWCGVPCVLVFYFVFYLAGNSVVNSRYCNLIKNYASKILRARTARRPKCSLCGISRGIKVLYTKY